MSLTTAQDFHAPTKESLSALVGRSKDELSSGDDVLSDTGSGVAKQNHDSNPSKGTETVQNDAPSASKTASVLIENNEMPAPTSYYYPARAHSSDYRRAQRSQPSMTAGSSESSKKIPAYRAPYVRDDASEPLSPYPVESWHHPDPSPPSPLDANTNSSSSSDSASDTASRTESYASSSNKSTAQRSDHIPKYWNGAFSRRQETTMFVNTDINYPPDFDEPISSCRKSFPIDDENCDKTRYSRGAFKDRSPLGSAGLSWTGYHSPPQSPPWNPASDYGPSTLHGQPKPAYQRQTSMFSNFNKPAHSADDFRKSSPTTSHFSCPSAFCHARWHHNPEPIIEEPISPPSSPVQSPMLLGSFTFHALSILTNIFRIQRLRLLQL